jgi:cold shock CspA family protein
MGNVGIWLLDFAAENCELFEAKDVQPTVWQPSQTRLPEKMKEKGWARATVLFFNLIWNGGSGFAICDDGKPVFIHFNDIVDGNGRKIADYAFPFLLAEQVVAVRFNESNRGRKATAVKVIEC